MVANAGSRRSCSKGDSIVVVVAKATVAAVHVAVQVRWPPLVAVCTTEAACVAISGSSGSSGYSSSSSSSSSNGSSRRLSEVVVIEVVTVVA